MKQYAKQFSIVSLLGLVCSVLFFQTEAFAQFPTCPFGSFGPGMMGGSWGWMGGLMTLFFWIFVIIAAVFLIRSLVRKGTGSGAYPAAASESAVDILKKRFARGQLSKEQFESMKRDLE